jgi:hypothetical protein
MAGDLGAEVRRVLSERAMKPAMFAVTVSLLSACATTDELDGPPLELGSQTSKADGTTKLNPHNVAVDQCEADGSAAIEAGAPWADVWASAITCVKAANDAVANKVPASVQAKFINATGLMCRLGQAAWPQAPDTEAQCNVEEGHFMLAVLIDRYVDFGPQYAIGSYNPPRDILQKHCFDDYDAAKPRIRTAADQLALENWLGDCTETVGEYFATHELTDRIVATGQPKTDVTPFVDAMVQELVTNVTATCDAIAATTTRGDAYRKLYAAECRWMTWTELATQIAIFAYEDPPTPSPTVTGGTFSATPNAIIPDDDDAGIDANVAVTGVAGVATLEVTVDITHSYVGDLLVQLKKDGRTIKTLEASAGADADNIHKTYAIPATDVGGELNGTYTLHVADLAQDDRGTLDKVTLTFK